MAHILLKFNKRVDHTSSVIRPQTFGRLRPVSSLIGPISHNRQTQSTNGLLCFHIKKPFAGIDQ